MTDRIPRFISRRALLTVWTGLTLLTLGACSAPQLAYNNADTLLRFRLYGYINPTQEQDAMMTAAIKRLHAWHRHHELPAYAETLSDVAMQLETGGLKASDIAETRERADARYRRLADRAVDEALPILRTFNERNVKALRKKLQERAEEYADEFLDGDASERHGVMVEKLTEHVERWVGRLDKAQIARLEAVVSRHPDFAALRLENRRHLHERFLAALRGVMNGNPGSEAELREVVVHWERHSLPHYREALDTWENDFRAALLDIARSLTPKQRRDTIATLQQYSSDLLALTDRSGPASSTAAQAELAPSMP